MGIGYAFDLGGSSPQLTGRKLISVATSGDLDCWVRDTGALRTLVAQFDLHLGGVTGLEVLDHQHFGAVTSALTKGEAQDILSQVGANLHRLFA